MGIKVSVEREIEIAKMYDAGLSIKKIMSETGHGQGVVTRSINTHSTMRASTVGRTHTYLFSELDDVTAYWLGFIAADGHLRDGAEDGHRYELVIEVNKKDEAHLDKLRDLLGFGTKIHRNRDDCVIFVFSSKSLVQNLSQWIECGNKTELDNFSDVPEEFKRDFVRGYFDGDGSTNGRSASITSCPATLHPLANFISDIVEEPARFYHKKNNKAIAARWNKNATKRFFEEFNGLPRLERKWEH